MKIWGSVFLFFSLIGCLACSDKEDDSIRFYNSSGQTEIEKFDGIVGENWLRIKGGSGVYSVSSGNEDVLVASVSGDVITLRGYKEGNAEITVTDNDNMLAAIPVSVKSRIRHIDIEELVFNASAEDVQIRETIEEELRNTCLVSDGGSYELEYKTWNNKVYGGVLIVNTGKQGEASFKGTFTWDENFKPNLITMKYNNQEFVMQYPWVYTATAREAGPMKIPLGEDFTTKYQELYPNAGITRAVRLQLVLIFR